jgi:Protein of unknown function (DUF3108)
MKKRIKVFLTALLLNSLFVPVLAQNSDSYINSSFQNGEQLEFHVYYNMSFIWVNAGNVSFKVSDEYLQGREVYHIAGDGKTASSYDWIFRVRDKYETYIGKDNLLPVKFVRDVCEGGCKFSNNIVFDQAKCKAYSDTNVFSVPKHTQDILSAIYFARNINYNNYKPGDRIPFTLFLDNKIYHAGVIYVGKEQITTKMGTYNAIKLAPEVIAGTIFKGGEKMEIWVSDDENHLPLRVNSPILVGSIKVDLVDYKNIRNPFSSMISKN